MDLKGLADCSRYSYPPNSLSLCGPYKQKDLLYYASSGKTDKGTVEILAHFSTLYPYLKLISSQNRIRDPFHPKVIEAYWLGNKLLSNIGIRQFAYHLSDTLQLKKKISRDRMENLLYKLDDGALPNHAFHVINIYKRTGYLDVSHTVTTMDACLINWGKVKNIQKDHLKIDTQALKIVNQELTFVTAERKIMFQGEKDYLNNIRLGDWVSYHWGYFCLILTPRQLKNLIYYTTLAIKIANTKRND